MILISNDRASASKKLNRMALIGTLMVSTTAFEITKEKFDGFRQTDLAKGGCVQNCSGRAPTFENSWDFAD